MWITEGIFIALVTALSNYPFTRLLKLLSVEAIHAIKPMCHRTYAALRAVGWEDLELEGGEIGSLQLLRVKSALDQLLDRIAALPQLLGGAREEEGC